MPFFCEEKIQPIPARACIRSRATGCSNKLYDAIIDLKYRGVNNSRNSAQFAIAN